MNHVLSDWKVDFFFPKIIKVLFKLLPPLKHDNDSNCSSKTNGSVSNNKADNNSSSSSGNSSKKDQLDNHIISKDNDNYHIKIHDYYSDKEIKQLHQYILTLCRYITSLHPNYTLYYFTSIYDDDDVDYYYRNASLSSSSTTTAAAAAIDTAITPTKSKSNIGYHLFSTNHHSKSSCPTSTSTNNNINNNNTIKNLTYYSYIIKCLQSNLFLNDPPTESAAFLLLDTLCCYSDKMRQGIQSEISIEFLKNKINILIPSVTEKVSKLFVTLYGINLEYSSSGRNSSSSSSYINKMKSTTTTTNSNNIVVDSNSIINHHYHHHHAKSVEEISCLQYIFEVILQITQNKLQKLNQTKHNIHALSSPSSSLASKYQPNINNHINKNNNDYDKNDNNDTNNSTSISSCFDCMFNIIYMIGMKIQIYKIDSLHDIITKIITLISYQFHDLSQFQLSDVHIIDIFFILVGKIEKSWLLINNIITPTSTNPDCGSNHSSNKNVGSSNGRSSASNRAAIIEYEFSKQSIILIEHFSRIAMTYDILNDPTKNANTNNNNKSNIPTNNVIYSSSGNNNNDDENINYKFTKSTLSDDEFDDDDDDNNMNNYDDDDDDDDDDDYPHSNHLSNNNKKTYLNSKNIEFFRLFLSNAKFDLFINEFLQQWELDPIELTCKLIHRDRCLI